MKKENNMIFLILAAIIFMIIGYTIVKSQEDNTLKGKARRASRKLEKQARKLKEELENQYGIVKEKALIAKEKAANALDEARQ